MARKSGSKGGGRPFGETSYSGKGLMTKYTRPSGGTRWGMTVSGKKASSNGRGLLKGQAATLKGWRSSP